MGFFVLWLAKFKDLLVNSGYSYTEQLQVTRWMFHGKD